MLTPVKKALAILLSGVSIQALADEPPIQYPANNTALTVIGSLTQSLHSTHTPGWGVGGETIYSYNAFNTGGSLKYFPEGTDGPVFNAFVGTGYKQLVQFQVGYGTEGTIYRFHSQIDLASLFEFGMNLTDFKLQLPDSYHAYPNNRFVGSLSIEKYDGHDYLDNVSVGIGLRY